MSAAINQVSSVGASGLNPLPNRGILQNQLSRYETQLADWCSCPGGKTPDGQKKIAELQDKASTVRIQLQRLEATQVQRPDAAAATSRDRRPAGITLVGSLLDVSA